jgi:hypothetical protein
MGEPAGDEAEGLSDGTSVVRRKSTDDERHNTSHPAIRQYGSQEHREPMSLKPNAA